MGDSVHNIPLERLSLASIPMFIVLAILVRWSLDYRTAIYAIGRMLSQLLLVGYVLASIFRATQPATILAVLAVMLSVASWIALRPLEKRTAHSYLVALGSIALGGLTTLLVVTQAVLTLEPWFAPRVMIPFAGMIFANAMNTVSLAAERFQAERSREEPYEDARRVALQASLIPLLNSFFAVGLVSLPGMMTGQVLSGVSPLIAVRYQIVVMCMVFGSGGISAACYLTLIRPIESENSR